MSPKTDFVRGFIAKEIDAAIRLDLQSKGTPVIPVRLEQREPPQTLRNIQWVDYFASDGEARLIQAIKRAWQIHCENNDASANQANSSDAKKPRG